MATFFIDLRMSLQVIVILMYHSLFSLHLFYGYALCNLAIQVTETNKCV